ncbi:GPI ethanolamine phosphate transferase 3 [Clonorchis sinensis]|uniref:GPI ethanolamine phosphate transferase 3 n=1 Tax=Clonorchis sinensis TaxID=79923 RepID=A0A419PNG8_CLOSI|nr:GPI ethanolamine phosphate transferase 3 [Clonorchis sinensis]
MEYEANPDHSKRFLLIFGFAVGLCTFGYGFLLNRTELPYTSVRLGNFVYRASYDRLIVLLVDGLAFDFVRKESATYTDNIVGHMSTINQLLRTPNARLLHFLADPPTTTLQRLKGLVTGSMPTFVDAGSNFGSSELKEDNLIHQWIQAKKRVRFVGDDTWMGLFPNSFHEAHPRPSFNVKDLDTVDQAVVSYVSSALNNSSDWDVLIGHMLGVDHCGHTYGPAHAEMRRKLREVDQFVRAIISKLNKNDLLVVLGDHGMTASGDHGGDSSAELDAALFVYSSRGFNSAGEQGFGNGTARIDQIDLVPTLATLTGVPIPYSNLGVCVKELLSPDVDFRQCLLVNFVQLINYTLTYCREIGPFPMESELKQFFANMTVLDRYEILAASETIDSDTMEHLLRKLQQAFRQHWTRFDLKKMWAGLCVMFSALLLAICLEAPSRKFELSVFGVQLSTAIMLLLVPTFNSIFQLSVSILVFGFGCVKLCFEAFSNLIFRPSHLSPLILVVLLAGSHFSNSFLVHEIHVTTYLVQTLLVYHFFRSVLRVPKQLSWLTFTYISPSLLLMLLTRLSRFLEVCREESFLSSSCRPNTDPWLTKSLSKLSFSEARSVVLFRLVLSVGTLIVITALHKSWLRKLDPLFRKCWTSMLLLQAGIIFAGLLLFGCWFLDAAQSIQSQVNTSSLHLLRVHFARGLLLILLLCFLHSAKLLPMIAPLRNDGRFISTNPPTENQFLLPSSNGLSNDHSVSVFKTGNPSCSHALEIWTCTTLVLLPLLGIMAFLNEVHILPMFCIIISVVVYAILHLSSLSAVPDQTDVSRRSIQADSWHVVVFICLLDNLSFYITGHQPTIAGIPWDAAFAAYAGDHQTRILPAFMVMIHLFAGPILLALSLPTFIVISLKPQLAGVSSSMGGCSAPGELVTVQLELLHISRAIDLLFWRFFTAKSILTFACALSACILRRHLMVWKIFAPRLLFSASSLLVTGVVLTFVRLIFVNHVLPTYYKHR